MRINLICPYREKDEVKALGARWDSKRRVWYIKGVKDLTPFDRWLPTELPVEKPKESRFTGPEVFVPLCDCYTPPWEDCIHTEMKTRKEMKNILGLSDLFF